MFLASDGDDVSTAELARRIGRALNKPARLLPVPTAVLRFAGMITGHGPQLDRLVGNFTVDPRGLRETLAWNPRFTMEQGLAATAAWYRRELSAQR